MTDSLGKGLDALIPDRNSEDLFHVMRPDDDPVVLPPSSESPPQELEKGKDIESLGARSLQDHFAPRRGDSVYWIEVEKIEPNPYQPRREFSDTTLQDLATSIREHGLLQPILVSKREIETPMGLEIRYQLIAGERRWRASKMAGLTQIPAVIRRGVPDDRIKLELALIENVQREELNPVERARAFKQLVDEFHLVQREIAARIGKSREMIANTLRLLTLPEDILTAVQTGKITEGHARAILMTGDDTVKQHKLFDYILSDRLNVRESENRARQVGGKVLIPRKRPGQAQEPEWREWQNRLQERLGTRVQFTRVGERGKIVVEFFSEEELRGILYKLVNEQKV